MMQGSSLNSGMRKGEHEWRIYICDRLQENRAQRGPDEKKFFFALTHSSASRY